MDRILRLLAPFALIVLLPIAAPAQVAGDQFDSDQVRAFTRSIVLHGGIKASAKILALQKHEPAVNKVFDQAFSEIQELAVKFDNNDPMSDIGRINGRAGQSPVQVSKDTIQLLKMAKKASRMTGGAYDFVSSQTGKSSNLKISKKKQEITLTSPETKIDLTSVMDGYLADRLMKTIWSANIDNAMVEVGKATRSVGNNVVGPWRTVVADMAGRYAARGMAITFSNASTATVKMGTKQPHAGKRMKNEPMEGLVRSATVIAKDAAMADAFANAIYKLGPEAGMALAKRLPNVHAIIRDGEGNLQKTPGI